VVGYGGRTVNTLRLWAARAAEEFDLDDFNRGSYIEAVENKVRAENLTKVLYPNDSTFEGKELRLRQQYFFVSCSIQDILRRFREAGNPWESLPDKVFIQLNDTHPALAIPEMMRLLIDREGFTWEGAWRLTTAVMGYTNHTILPEALERWPVAMLERILPRHLQIIYGINARFLKYAASQLPPDAARLRRMSLIDEDGDRSIRMAHLAIVGSSSVNGVAELHTRLLKERVLRDFAELWPQKFTNKTNGITQRRWLLKANPPLAGLISEAIGDGWVTDLEQLRRLEPLAEDAAFRERFRAVKQRNKEALATLIANEVGVIVSPDSLFDVQAKRLHEYKRQLLLVLYTILQYNRLKDDPDLDIVPRTMIFSAKAAPGYAMSKLVIKMIHEVAAVINGDRDIRGCLRVVFLPNYQVSLAEQIIPAANLSEQISLAGTEASGTGNMKFQLNGALTIGTLDGANVEIREEVGPDNIFIFGMTPDEVAERRATYSPWALFHGDADIRRVLQMIERDAFSETEPGIFLPIVNALLHWGDQYMLLADLPSYAAVQAEVDQTYREPDVWDRKAILNVAGAGKFSSDRTIRQYAEEIWRIHPCPVEGD
jgi:starch phosphorylase